MKNQFKKLLIMQLKKYNLLEPEILNNMSPKEKLEFYENLICNEYYSTQSLFSVRKDFQDQLYLLDEIFNLKKEYIKFGISCYFYLCLLISDEHGIINYQYDYDLIISIDNIPKISENPLKKMMIAKMKIELINNLEDLPDYNEEKFNEIIENNRVIIDNNINEIKKLKINLTTDEIILMKIEDIYVKVIESIIESSEFDEIKDIETIFSQLDLEVINIANIKYNELEKLTKNEKFMISQVQDLYNNKKINYYFILVKYIFKTNSNFNIITLFKEFNDFLIKILKSHLYDLLSNFKDDEIINERMDFILKNVLISEYYYNEYSKVIKLIKFYYKNKDNESQKNEIESIELKFKNNNLNYSESPLPLKEIEKFCILLFRDNFTYEISIKNKYVFEEKYKVGNNNIIYEDKYIKYIRKKLCNENSENNLDPTKIKNAKRLFEILNNIRQELNNKFNNSIKLCYIFKIINKKTNQLYDISCECNISGLIGNYKNKFIIKDILNKEINILDIISKNKPTISFLYKEYKEIIEEQNRKKNDERIIIDEDLYSSLNIKRNLIVDKEHNGIYKKLFDQISDLKKKDQQIEYICTNQNGEKNGILLIDMIDENKAQLFFHEIVDFKIECICSIDNEETKEDTKNNGNYNVNNYDNIIIIGGSNKGEKEYKVKYYQIFKYEQMENQWEEFQDKELSKLNFNSNIIKMYTKGGELNICLKEKTHILFIKNNDGK